MADVRLPPVSDGMQKALARFDRVVSDILNGGTGSLMPRARTLEDFFEELRNRRDDDPFLVENPGP